MPAYKYTFKDGRTKWYANFYYVDWTGTKKHVCKRGFATKREAVSFEKGFLDQQKESSDIRFDALVKNYMEDMSHRLKPTTMDNKENIIAHHILPYFQNQKTCDINAIKIRQWQNQLISHKEPSGKGFSKTYLKSIHNQMSAIMNYAVKHYGLSVNPCAAAGSIGASKADEMQIWTREEFEQFLSTVRKSAVRLAFDILFYTGMRSGELLALTRADILDSHKISVSKNFAVVKGRQIITTPKTAKGKREIAIPDSLYDEIMEYIRKLGGIAPDDRIFYFTKSALEKEIERGAKEAGLKKIRVHDLRHSHASMLIEMGVSPKEIAERLGHESVKTTLDTYAHLYPEREAVLASRLNDMRTGGGKASEE